MTPSYRPVIIKKQVMTRAKCSRHFKMNLVSCVNVEEAKEKTFCFDYN